MAGIEYRDGNNMVIVPPDGGIGTTAWSRFPSELFPIATDMARGILSDSAKAEAYRLFREVRLAEDLLKMTRLQMLHFQQIPSKEEDPDIENRWSDESIEWYKKRLEGDNLERQTELTRIHGELRKRNESPEFNSAYMYISLQVRKMVQLSLSRFATEQDDVSDPITVGVYNGTIVDLIDYNLKALGESS